MMDYPALSFRELIQKVKKLGFKKVRQKGSHIRFAHSDGRKTTIPDHRSKSVPHGLLIKIIFLWGGAYFTGAKHIQL